MNTIYVDVLVIVNIYVNFLLLKTTAKITRSASVFSRMIVASVYGSLYSLVILAPNLSTSLNLIIKSIAAITIVIIAFGIINTKRVIINSITFFAVNFIFAGGIYAVYTWLKPEFVHYNNACIYIDFSLIVLLVTTAVLYYIVSLIRIIYDKIPDYSDKYAIVIRYKGRSAVFNGLADTGNSLIDFFSGSPVIICSKEAVCSLVGKAFDKDHIEDFPKGFRLIPCSTIVKDDVIPIFRPDEIIICDTENDRQKKVDAVVGIASDSDKAIFNPKLIKI